MFYNEKIECPNCGARIDLGHLKKIDLETQVCPYCYFNLHTYRKDLEERLKRAEATLFAI